MKGFFKKHPELLILLIVVIAIDGFIVWMWLDDLSATEKSKQAHEKLKNDAKAINVSKWRVNSQNAKLAEDESSKWEKSLEGLLKAQQEKYVYSIDYRKTTDQPATALRKLKDIVDKLSQEILKDKNATADKLSFHTYAYENTLLTMKVEEIESVFIILKGLERLIHNSIQADIISLDAVKRPNQLAFEEDKDLETKRYTYDLTFKVTADGLKKLLNQIINDSEYFFDINNITINAQEQITASGSDLIPKVARQANTTQSAAPKSKGRGIEDLEAGFNNLVGGGNNEVDPDEPVIYQDSISPFSQAINQVTISVDWVQFIKEKK